MIRKRPVVACICVALLVLALPGLALAAPGDVGAQVTGANVAPTITSVALKDSTDTGTDAMVPQQEYHLEVVASDQNTIEDIAEIKVTIYYDSSVGAGTPGSSWDADENAIFKWTPAGGWTMENGGATTTWALVSANCSSPSDMTLTSGTWKLAFKPGKLAKAAGGTDTDEWVCHVVVKDAGGLTASGSDAGNSMAAYIEIATDPATISFGEVSPGGTMAIQNPTDHILTTKVTTNKAYNLAVQASSPWSAGADKTMALNGSGNPGNREFSLAIDDEGDASGNPVSPQWISTSSAQITDMSGLAAPTTDAGASEGTADKDFYMQVKLGNVLPGTYSGTITFTASN